MSGPDGYAEGTPDGYADGTPDGYAEGGGRHRTGASPGPGHEGTAHYGDRDEPAAYPGAGEPGYGAEDQGYDRQATSEFGYGSPAGAVGYSDPADVPAYRDPGAADEYVPGAAAGYDGPGDTAAYGGPDATADPAGAEDTIDEAYTYREPEPASGGEPAGPGSGDPPSPRSGDEEDAAAFISGPDEPSAHDDTAEPAPYVAPYDPNTGADTEPFRGPFEPHPAQPKLSDYQPTGPLPVAMASSDGVPASSADAGPRPDTHVADGIGDGRIPDACLPDDGSRTDVPVRYGAAGLDAEGESDRDGSEEKLEKIKDLYLTVEAIGDDNVDKHFDELLQRQRELISDYFKETGIGGGKARISPLDQPGQEGQAAQPGQADQPVITDHDPSSN